MTLPVAIVIPTYNRQALIAQAVTAALSQSHPDNVVLVIDDGSTDQTGGALAAFQGHPRFCHIRLAVNVGTAQAKNVGIMLAGQRAVTFHDSDDLPYRDKVMRQARVMAQPDIGADPCLNWKMAHHRPGDSLRIGLVLSWHELVMPDGRSFTIRRSLSLVDDFFPNLQMGSTVPGDWTHINSGLFHPQVFAKLGGFSDCIEEDREMRNRIIMAGEVIWMIEAALMTKFETEGALTQDTGTDYTSDRRGKDRERVWAQVETWLRDRRIDPVAVDLPPDIIASASNTDVLTLSDARATPATRDWLATWLHDHHG